MGLAVIAMVVIAIILLIAVPVLMRVFSEAADRDPEESGSDDTGERKESQGGRSGPRR